MSERARTLTAAHELVRRGWPGRDASTRKWVAHYRRAADIYRHVAETDPGHRHEALFWASDARASASALAAKGGTDDDGQ